MDTRKPLIVDTSVLFAFIDRDDPTHADSGKLILSWEGELVVSPFVVAEADYFVLSRLGVEAQLNFLEDLRLSFHVAQLDSDNLGTATKVCRKYRGLQLGITDASLVVLAEEFGTEFIATFDRRHFRAVEPLQGGSFELLPG